MSCDTVRDWLLEHPVPAFDAVADHLAGCAGCRLLAAEIEALEAAVDDELDDFAHGTDFAAVWADTVGAETPRRRRPMMGWMAWLAAAGTLVFAATPGAWTDGSPADPHEVPSVCDRLSDLEAHALLGRLSVAQVDCLQDRIEDDGQQGSDRLDASMVLLAHLWSATMSHEGWLDAAQYQLDVLADPSPDLAYKISLFLVKERPVALDEVVRITDLALDGQSVWPEPIRAKRVAALHKIRSSAGQLAWAAAEAEGAPTDDLRRATREMAEAWLTHVRDADLDVSVAAELCRSVGCD